MSFKGKTVNVTHIKMSFKGKTVIVTGASSGIGAGIAILFAKEGADVVIVARNEEKLKNISAKCEEVGNKPLVIKADVCKEEDAKRITKETIDKYGKLDVLINNAGISRHADLSSEVFMKVYDEVMNTNLRSAVMMSYFATPYLIESKGNVINISSNASKHTLKCPTLSIYCTSKAGLDHFSRCIAAELAPKGVRVNTVNPGPVLTDIIKNSGTPSVEIDALWKQLQQGTALNRISDVEEIADLTLFLASDKARGITGSSFFCDNGVMLK